MRPVDLLLVDETRPVLFPDLHPFEGFTARQAKLLNERRFGWGIKVKTIDSFPEVVEGIFMGITLLPTRGSGGLFDRELSVREDAGVTRHCAIDGVLDLLWTVEHFTCGYCDEWAPVDDLVVRTAGPSELFDRWSDERYEFYAHPHDCTGDR